MELFRFKNHFKRFIIWKHSCWDHICGWKQMQKGIPIQQFVKETYICQILNSSTSIVRHVTFGFQYRDEKIEMVLWAEGEKSRRHCLMKTTAKEKKKQVPI